MISKFKLKKKQKNKKKKGFTLIELLAVIVILAVIMVITIPTVIGSMNNAKLKAEEIFIASIEKSLNDFIEKELQYSDYTFEEPKKEYVVVDIPNKYKITEILKKEGDNNVPITLNDFDELGYYPKNDLINPKDETICNENENPTVEIYKDKINSNQYYYYLDLDCLDEPLTNLPLPEEPDLSGGLIPVIYDETKKESTGWFVADPTTEWYNYDKQEWANAVAVLNKDKYAPGGVIKPFKDDGNPNEIQQSDLLAMFVWIPRYSYTIGCKDVNSDGQEDCIGYQLDGARNLQVGNNGVKIPGAIDIRFTISGIKHSLKENELPQYSYNDPNNRKTKNWLTHPAFWWDKNNDNVRDKDEELSGIWIGKFETSASTSSNCYNKTTANCLIEQNEIRILPNVASMRYQDLSNFHNYSKYISNNNYYGIDNNYEPHGMKNNEWAAVAYLSQSKYGKYGNNNYTNNHKDIYMNNSSQYITGSSWGKYALDASYNTTAYPYDNTSIISDANGNGLKGVGASTTGNIYGIYDMNGGADEIMFSIINPLTDNLFEDYGGIYYKDLKDNNFFEIYKDADSAKNKKDYTIGHALFETYKWGGSSKNPTLNVSGNKWLTRGGIYTGKNSTSGIFASSYAHGMSHPNNSFRIVLVCT